MIVLLSGGLDSCVLAAALRDPHQPLCLSFDYGQRHYRELRSAAAVAWELNLDHRVLTLPQFSRLTPHGPPAPVGHYTDEIQRATVTPHRNLAFLALAATLGHESIAYAAHSGDHAIYPDCRPAFVNALAETLLHSDYSTTDLIVPFLHRTKAEIVKLGVELGAPLHLTWSCYEGGEKHCGGCGTCVERREAFQLAGVPDPTVYA